MESQLATLATDRGTTFAKLFKVEGIQTILFKFWAFRVYTLNNLTPIRLFCVKGRFSGLSGIKTDHVWPEIRPLGFKGLKLKKQSLLACYAQLYKSNSFVYFPNKMSFSNNVWSRGIV